MTKIFCLAVCCYLLLLVSQVGAAQDRAVAKVWGKTIHASEIRPAERDATAKRAALGDAAYKSWFENEARKRLREIVWCELSKGFLERNSLAPTADELKAYVASVEHNAADRCLGPQGESNDMASLATLKFDQFLYKKYQGRVVPKGSQWMPLDARQAYLNEAREKRIVEILDRRYSNVLTFTAPETSTAANADDKAKTYFEQPWWEVANPQSQKPDRRYTIKPLNGDKQVRIDCANGFSFVIQKGSDNFWYEELKIRGGAEVKYRDISEAASARCSSVSP
jgi:hypothetical protein